jgi:hypothetical protein
MANALIDQRRKTTVCIVGYASSCELNKSHLGSPSLPFTAILNCCLQPM